MNIIFYFFLKYQIMNIIDEEFQEYTWEDFK